MVTIKIVCGKHGNTGKTLLSTSLLIYHLNKNRKTAALDWNLNNPDLFYSLFFFEKEDSRKVKNFIYEELSVNKTKKKLRVYWAQDSESLQDSDFWEYLDSLYPIIEKQTICVVDTRVDITRLPNWKQDVSSVSKRLNKAKIEIYYIMGWRYLPDEIAAMESSIKWLHKNFKDVEIIFVWNVYEQTKPRKLFWKKLGWSVYGEYEKRLKKADKRAELVFLTLTNLMRKYSFYKVRGLDPDEIPELWEPLFKAIFNRLEENEVVQNWLLIPEKTDMVYTSDVNVVGRKGDLKMVQDSRKQFYKYVKEFEGMRDRLFKNK